MQKVLDNLRNSAAQTTMATVLPAIARQDRLQSEARSESSQHAKDEKPSTSAIGMYIVENQVVTAEILWCLKMVQNHMSMRCTKLID